MGALPEPHEPPAGALRRSPEMAPPLRAVPRCTEASTPEPERAGPRSAPPPPAAEPVAPEAQQDPDQERQDATGGGAGEAGPEEEGHQEQDQGPGLDVESLHHLRSQVLQALSKADLWSQSLPPLSQVWAQALEGEHLPAHPVLRVGEVARLVVSLPLAWLAGLVAFCLVSAPRTAALAAGAVSVWLVVSTLVGAAAELLT